MFWKEILSFLAIAITVYAFYPYIRSIHQGDVKPHVFSWVIWGITTLIAFFASFADRGGVGSIPIGVSSCITIYVAALAYTKKSDLEITKVDWIFFISAISSIPIWVFTSNPLGAIVILTFVDLLGFGPTVRKAYDHPRDENIGFFSLFMLRNLISIGALENYSLTTIMFPASIALSCFGLIVLILIRRKFTLNNHLNAYKNLE
ncbi:hypothetical protein [Leptospira sp. GIMC2001]|uniref:hypothetical protein n=1 Tax=Leptospira sp. GIMC2001 TaxID=1513297 RepID=UPI00234B6579|nr:hypothetical protein [Leptospira sp. GIMC2001]WCL50491.1 hypothetical protein O4O04_06635 [Leptospira sp. GIMC2001]